MRDAFDQLLAAAKAWARDARIAGWLSPEDSVPLDAVENRSPAMLFDGSVHRPLVVAFFGGTGVGKSTLLNRLAGQEIARTGVERPTSREVSVYLHESLQIRQLPKGFPVDRVRTAYHRDERRRQVLWIDMPDIDSTEASNREFVIEWLPHIDVLIYVVSPERYRDDKGWRLLRAHGHEHAWLFVMNQWDRGQTVQLDDFAKLLTRGGFLDPLILRTDCRENAELRKPDDFARLQEIIQSLAEIHVIEQLEIRAMDQRYEQLQSALTACLSKLGVEQALNELQTSWAEIWRETEAGLLKGLEWPIREVARAFVRHESSPLQKSIDLNKSAEVKTAAGQPPPATILWDDWAQMQLQDALDRLVVEAGNVVPVAPLKAGLKDVPQIARKQVLSESQRALRQALANPGNAAQRFFLKLTGLCAFLLPLVAIGLVSWQAVTAYYASALTHAGYLGADFAIHSGLVIVISWLFPYFLYRKLKPSAERVAEKGLRSGVASGLARIQTQVDEALRLFKEDWRRRIAEGQRLLAVEKPPREPAQALPQQELLKRMLTKQERTTC
ncbi:MAG TPA: GTPase [Methylococcaceae bacterium]|nr:GTPase [Methylococcaceae bacterium]